MVKSRFYHLSGIVWAKEGLVDVILVKMERCSLLALGVRCHIWNFNLITLSKLFIPIP